MSTFAAAISSGQPCLWVTISLMLSAVW